MKTVHKFRIYPTAEQVHYINGCCGACRFVYNMTLGLWAAHKEWLDAKAGCSYLFQCLSHTQEKQPEKIINRIKRCFDISDETAKQLIPGIPHDAYLSLIKDAFEKLLWNKYAFSLAEIDSLLTQEKLINTQQLSKILTKIKATKYKWLNDYSAQALASVVFNDLNAAIQNFFKKRGGFPKFKKRGYSGSFSNQNNTQGTQNRLVAHAQNWGYLTVIKLSKIRTRVHRPCQGQLLTVKISKSSAGEYYASCLFETEEDAPAKPAFVPEQTIGLNPGIRHLVTDSNGVKFPNIKHLEARLKKLAVISRRLQKKRDANPEWKTSKRYEQLRKKMAALHDKVVRQRSDHLHKITRILTNNPNITTIGNQKWDIKQMMGTFLASSIGDCSWYEFSRQLKYKSDRYGKNYHEIDGDIPTSKRCSQCGYINEELTGIKSLRIRRWICPECNAVHDRDINAAIVVRDEVIKELQET